MSDYTIERLDWVVMLSGTVIGGVLFGFPSSWEIPPILIGALIGFFSYAWVVAISKVSGFTRRPKTLIRRKSQTFAFFLVWGVICYLLVDAAWSRHWFFFAVIVLLALPFAVLCHATIVRICFSNTTDNNAVHTEHGLRGFTNGKSSFRAR